MKITGGRSNSPSKPRKPSEGSETWTGGVSKCCFSVLSFQPVTNREVGEGENNEKVKCQRVNLK